MTDKPNIYQRINAVRLAVPCVMKDTEVRDGGGYKAVSHDMVTAALRPALIENGVIVYTECLESEHVSTGKQTRSGAPIIRMDGLFRTVFINADNPPDFFTVSLRSSAEDFGDKAPGKALSYAQKHAMLKVFNLETREDEESRLAPAAPVETITESQAADMRAKLEEVGADTSRFLLYMKVDALEEIPASKLTLAYEAINRKAKHGTTH